MLRLVVLLPKDRDACGIIRLLDGERLLLGPWPVAGRGTDRLAAEFGNPARSTLQRYGDTPLGLYRITGRLGSGPGTPFPQSEFGRHGLITLEPLAGDALIAEANGRFNNAIVGGCPDRDGRLRSTAGALRLKDEHLRRLLRAFDEHTSLDCEVKDGPARSRAALVAVTHRFVGTDPPLGLRTVAEASSDLRRPSAAASPSARRKVGVLLGVTITFMRVDNMIAGQTRADAPQSAGSTTSASTGNQSQQTSSAPSNPLAPGYISDDPATLRQRYIELKSTQDVAAKLTPTDVHELQQRAQTYQQAANNIASGLKDMQAAKDDSERYSDYAKVYASAKIIKGLGDFSSTMLQALPGEGKAFGVALDKVNNTIEASQNTAEAAGKLQEGDVKGALVSGVKAGISGAKAGGGLSEEAAQPLEARANAAGISNDAAQAKDFDKKLDVTLDTIDSIGSAMGFTKTLSTGAKVLKSAHEISEGINDIKETSAEQQERGDMMDKMIDHARGQMENVQAHADALNDVLSQPNYSSADTDTQKEMTEIERKLPSVADDTAAEVNQATSSKYLGLIDEATKAAPGDTGSGGPPVAVPSPY